MLRALAAALALALLTAAAPSPSPLPSSSPSAPPPVPASPLPTGGEATPHLGPQARAHWAVGTTDTKTQELVDRAVAMLYAFDIGQARADFVEASERQPSLAFPYLGAALSETFDINLPSTPQGEERGAAMVAKARAHFAHASEVERVLADGLAKRYGAGTQRQRLSRFADTLDAYADGHRSDANVLVVTALALYLAIPDGFTEHGGLRPRARRALADLDDALKLEPQNLGAHHMRIHLLENADRTKDAVPDAEALENYRYAPGMSHLIHMPSHVWIHLGEYERLIDDNEKAIANDKAWFALGDGPGQRYMRGYHQHDVEFALYGLTTLGRNADARALAQSESAEMRADVELRLHADPGGIPADLHLQRGIAAARRGDAAQARAERAHFGADSIPRALIDAALARRSGDQAAAVAAFAALYDRTKSWQTGDPKTYWWIPIGESYGAALLGARRPAEAETVFGAELKRFPNDPHLEWGLAEAQKAQGKDDAAARAAYRTHWKGSRDLSLADLG